MGVGSELRRNSGLPLIAGGSAVAGGNLVAITGAWQALTVQNVNEAIVGVARASAASLEPIDVREISGGDVVRAVAAATIAAGNLVGFASNATAAGPGNTIVQVTKYGPVSKGASLGTGTWTAGEALENANPGNTFAFRVNPRQLAGLS